MNPADDDDDKRPSKWGTLSVLMMVAAAPGLWLGFEIYTESEKDAAVSSGIGGALSGLGVLFGLGVMAVAAILLIAGAIVFIRSAKD